MHTVYKKYALTALPAFWVSGQLHDRILNKIQDDDTIYAAENSCL